MQLRTLDTTSWSAIHRQEFGSERSPLFWEDFKEYLVKGEKIRGFVIPTVKDNCVDDVSIVFGHCFEGFGWDLCDPW